MSYSSQAKAYLGVEVTEQDFIRKANAPAPCCAERPNSKTAKFCAACGAPQIQQTQTWEFKPEAAKSFVDSEIDLEDLDFKAEGFLAQLDPNYSPYSLRVAYESYLSLEYFHEEDQEAWILGVEIIDTQTLEEYDLKDIEPMCAPIRRALTDLGIDRPVKLIVRCTSY